MDAELIRNPVLIWFLVGLGMFVVEMMGPGLVFLFFGVGAWIVALLCAFTPITLNVQLFLFIVFSVLSLVFFRNGLKKVFHGHVNNVQNPDQDMDEYGGQKAVVKEEIVPGRGGKVEFNGTLWEAESDEQIPAEALVKIIKKDNLTFKVEKIS